MTASLTAARWGVLWIAVLGYGIAAGLTVWVWICRGVVDQEDYTKFVHYGHSNDQFVVKEVNDTGDGTGGVVDTANNTDVGTVTVLVVSRR